MNHDFPPVMPLGTFSAAYGSGHIKSTNIRDVCSRQDGLWERYRKMRKFLERGGETATALFCCD
jgi:hypothetical protein